MTRSTDDVIKGRSRIRDPPLLSLRSASSLNKTRVVALRFHTASALCLAEAREENLVLREINPFRRILLLPVIVRTEL